MRRGPERRTRPLRAGFFVWYLTLPDSLRTASLLLRPGAAWRFILVRIRQHEPTRSFPGAPIVLGGEQRIANSFSSAARW
jgi:hypothetical protein